MRCHHFRFAGVGIGYLCSPKPLAPVCRRGCTVSPEKGGALRNQSTGGRRLGVAAVICGVLFGGPLLLLQNSSSARSARTDATTAPDSHQGMTHASRGGAAARGGVHLQTQPVDYQTPTTTTAPSPATAAPPAATTPAPSATTTTVSPPPPPPPSTTTTTTPPPPPPPPAPANRESGQATWYSAAPPGYCASPTLSFGTVLTVTNDLTGATTSCTVDDREAAGYPRVVDMSPQGFAQIASTSQGVVQVTISW